MKKYLFILLAASALLAAGCEEKEDAGQLEEVVLTADIADLDVTTRATLTSINASEWEPGDVIKVTADGKSYTFVTVEGGCPAEFTGSLPKGTTSITARYPSVQELPSDQIAVMDGIDPEANLMEAKADISRSKSVTFSHSVAFVRVTVESENMRMVSVTAEKSELAEGSRAVRLMSDTGRALKPGVYYAAVYPVEDEKLTVVTKSERLTMTKAVENISLAAGENLVIRDPDVKWEGSSSIKGPEQFIFVQTADWQYNSAKIANIFGGSADKKVGVGEACMFYLFERSLATLESELRSHLAAAQTYDVPVLVELDPITFWDSVPELWNWFDPGKPGFNDANRENVEWYGWGSEYAVKIGWLNWGSLCRLAPMCNLFSPAYQAAVRSRMTAMMSIVDKWYRALPADKKYLLVGVKIIGEFALGWNNWYYPNGNNYYGTPEGTEPSYGLNEWSDPNFGMQQIGYAALTYSGVKTSGTVTAADIVAVEKKYQEWIADIADDYSFSRDMLFAHSGCVGEHLSTCMLDSACPSWSFYGWEALDVKRASYCMQLARESSAPYWAVSEWGIGEGSSTEAYHSGLSNALGVPKCRYVSIFENVVGDYNASGAPENSAAVAAIKAIQEERK